MAIGSQDRIVWRSVVLPMALVRDLLYKLFQKRKEQNMIARDRPMVDIDASLLGYKHLDKSSFTPTQAIEAIARDFSEHLIDCNITCDNREKRHHSKVAHTKRVSERAKDNIKLVMARIEAASLRNSRGTTNDAAGDAAREKELTKTIRSLERKQNRQLPSNFASSLEQFASSYKSEGKGVITFEEAITQADPCIARRAVKAMIEAMVSGDSDFPMYVGPRQEDAIRGQNISSPSANSSDKMLPEKRDDGPAGTWPQLFEETIAVLHEARY